MNSKPGLPHQISGLLGLIPAGALKFSLGSGLGISWGWADCTAILLASLALVLIVTGYLRQKREEDRKRARFL